MKNGADSLQVVINLETTTAKENNLNTLSMVTATRIDMYGRFKVLGPVLMRM